MVTSFIDISKSSGQDAVKLYLKQIIEKNTNTNLVTDLQKNGLHAPRTDDQDLSDLVEKVTGSSLVADTEISKIHAHSNKTTLDKITESGNLPLWNGGAWPGGDPGGDIDGGSYI